MMIVKKLKNFTKKNIVNKNYGDYMENCKTRLKMLPVCSCGYVFKDGVIIHQSINDYMFRIGYPEYSIEPSICPMCKKEIECIDYNSYMIKNYE